MTDKTEDESKGGRPRTTLNDIPEDWKDIILGLSADGASAVECQCAINVGRSGWDTLIEDCDEFRATVQQAKRLCHAWWEKLGRKGAAGGNVNAVVWKFNMQNRFKWSDKQEIDNTSSDGSMTPTSIERVIIRADDKAKD